MLPGTEWRIDDAAAADVPAITAIWHAGWQDGHAGLVPDSLAGLRTKDSFLKRTGGLVPVTRVARRDGRVAGFVMVRDDELYQMYVAPQVRGAGVAQTLMADALTRIRAAGHGTAWLACAIGNDRAARFYEKTGWRNARTETVMVDTLVGDYALEVWRFERVL